jgi:hypothetical protein
MLAKVSKGPAGRRVKVNPIEVGKVYYRGRTVLAPSVPALFSHVCKNVQFPIHPVG